MCALDGGSRGNGCDCDVVEYCSGVILPPEGTFSQRLGTKVPLVCKFLAGGRISYGIPSKTPAPASQSRRRACYSSNRVQNAPPGVMFSPRGAFPQRRRTEPHLRRLFGAGGTISYGIPSKTPAAAPYSRRRAHPCSLCARNPCVGVIAFVCGVFLIRARRPSRP